MTEIDPAHFRRVMGRFATGVTVITATVAEETRGMTANAFISGSLDPPLCVVSVTKRAHMHPHLTKAGRFAVNILASGQEHYATHYSGRPIAGLRVNFHAVGGVAILADASAWMTAETVATHDCGDHTLFVGHIRRMEADERPPLLYHAGRYGALVPTHEVPQPVPEFW